MKSNRMGLAIALVVILLATAASTAEVALDYDVYKSRVEPIFLKKRPGHGRCYVCHSEGNNAFRLQKLSAREQFLVRGAITAQFSDSCRPDSRGRSRQEPTSTATARARGRRPCISLRR